MKSLKRINTFLAENLLHSFIAARCTLHVQRQTLQLNMHFIYAIRISRAYIKYHRIYTGNMRRIVP